MWEEVLLGKVDPQSGTKFSSPSRSHQKLSGGVKEARKQKQQHWDINSPLTLRSSASFRNSKLRLLTSPYAQTWKTPVWSSPCLPVFTCAPLRMGPQGDDSILLVILFMKVLLSLPVAMVKHQISKLAGMCLFGRFSQVFISNRCETLWLLIKHVTSTFSLRASWQTFFISFAYDGGELNNKACC